MLVKKGMLFMSLIVLIISGNLWLTKVIYCDRGIGQANSGD
jgi:hypothetical protein